MIDFNIKALISVNIDGSKTLLCIVNESFDTQSWANSRKRSFALLQIVKIEEYFNTNRK